MISSIKLKIKMDETVDTDSEATLTDSSAELAPDFSILEDSGTSDESEALKQRLDIIAQLNGKELESDLKRSLNEGNVIIPAGTLVYSTEFSPGELATISQFGIINPQIFEGWENASPTSSVNFYRINSEKVLPEAIQELEDSNKAPKVETKPVTFILDTRIPGIKALLPEEIAEGDLSATVLGGLPRSGIAAVVVSEELLNGTEAVPNIRAMFDKSIPILKESGKKITDEEIAHLALQDLYSVGVAKPVGYLPVSTIEELGKKDLKIAITELESKGLNTIVVSEEESTVLSGALYAYDKEALAKLLAENAETIKAHGWTIDPHDFVVRIAKEDVEDENLYRVVAMAFSDRRPEYSGPQD
jgi:hypothetical protein